MDMLDSETKIHDYALERLMMLSDGVFSIAMTLLALEIRPPEHWDQGLLPLLAFMSPSIQAFFWSFFSACIFWAIHRRQFGFYRRTDFVHSALNLVLLGEITLLPVTTRILTILGLSPEALLFYLGLFALIGLTSAAVWIYAAFLSDIVGPGIGAGARIVTAVNNGVLPVAMTGLGLLAATPGHVWALILMPLVFGGGMGLRHLALGLDRRNALAAVVESGGH